MMAEQSPPPGPEPGPTPCSTRLEAQPATTPRKQHHTIRRQDMDINSALAGYGDDK